MGTGSAGLGTKKGFPMILDEAKSRRRGIDSPHSRVAVAEGVGGVPYRFQAAGETVFSFGCRCPHYPAKNLEFEIFDLKFFFIRPPEAKGKSRAAGEVDLSFLLTRPGGFG